MFCNQKICSHNPETVGSSPASAAIKTPDFYKKSGVFLTFLGIFWTLKLALGSLWGSRPKPDF